MPSTKIQKYANSKICCIATNVHKSDKKLKYGLEEAACQINKDTIANIFLETLMCNPVASDSLWYTATLSAKWVDKSSPAYTYGNNATVINNGFITSFDNNKVLTFNVNGIFNWANNDIANVEISEAIVAAFNVQNADDIFLTYVYNATTDLYDFTFVWNESWGNDTNVPNILSIGGVFNNLFDTTGTIGTITVTTVKTDNCLTELQLCNLKSWIDNYCKSC